VTGATLAALAVPAVLLALFSHRYRWWRRAVPQSRPRILMYHMVRDPVPGATFNKLRVPPARFEAQLRWLRDRGWQFAFMSDLETPEALPEKTVILTFDDGYADNLLNADPLMARFGAVATLYLVEDRFDRDWSTSKKAHHDSGELMREEKLSDAQVEEMLASGRWELGGHTRTHANLARAGDGERMEEIVGSRSTLAARFDVPLSSFAYPFGIYGDADVDAVRDAGYTTAVTTDEGIPEDVRAEALELPRIKVSGRDNLLAFRFRMRSGRR
jgi:peptidoglycan/xylan/chitin deacetylase (PgdA/CDA1 family)